MLIDSGITTQLVGPMKMCLNETYRREWVGTYCLKCLLLKIGLKKKKKKRRYVMAIAFQRCFLMRH
jgi:hypothetical protein